MKATDVIKKLQKDLSLQGLHICNPEATAFDKSLWIQKGCFASAPKATSHRKKKSHITMDLSGYTAYPGLINAHDHLLGTYLPRVGNGPYLNWKPWDEDLKVSRLYQERSQISSQNLYLLGSYRQLFSGVTTVSDHIPHVVNKDLIGACHVRILKDYALSHEASSYDLNWGDGILKEITKSKQKKIPYLCHLEEGYDKEAMKGTLILDKHGALTRRSILIHCVSCHKKDIELIARKKANVVWCPVSNVYMFNDTAKIHLFLKAGVNVCLGTDSPMSGGVHLFDELKFAKAIYKKFFKKELSYQTLFQMVTENPAKAFDLHKTLGSIKTGKTADVLILKNKGKDSYKRLVTARLHDVEIVMREGVPFVVKEEHAQILTDKRYYERVLLCGHPYYVIGTPLKLLKEIRRNVGFEKQFDFFPIASP